MSNEYELRTIQPVTRYSFLVGKHIIYTIGHSNRSIEQFLELLEENKIELLVDVRTFPMSRYNPQFNKEALFLALKHQGISYLHLAALGGRRGKTNKSSHNTAWEHTSFRNYADYAETEPFREGLEELITLAREKRTAYMCAEALWWRCHRRIITDYLLARGWDVRHIMEPGKTQEAELNERAVIHENGTITYPASQESLEL
jgi:uncharacterized protein (DUF488 family)